LLVRDGFRELVGAEDYSKLGIKLISGGIAARRSYAAKNREVVARVIKATMESIKVMSTQEALAKKILSKYTRLLNPSCSTGFTNLPWRRLASSVAIPPSHGKRSVPWRA
jgi:hypothetical protein